MVKSKAHRLFANGDSSSANPNLVKYSTMVNLMQRLWINVSHERNRTFKEKQGAACPKRFEIQGTEADVSRAELDKGHKLAKRQFEYYVGP